MMISKFICNTLSYIDVKTAIWSLKVFTMMLNLEFFVNQCFGGPFDKQLMSS